MRAARSANSHVEAPTRTRTQIRTRMHPNGRSRSRSRSRTRTRTRSRSRNKPPTDGRETRQWPSFRLVWLWLWSHLEKINPREFALGPTDNFKLDSRGFQDVCIYNILSTPDLEACYPNDTPVQATRNSKAFVVHHSRAD